MMRGGGHTGGLPEIFALVVAVLLPPVLQATGQDYYIGFATRVLIFALAATSLNFVVGSGGMVSFGHAAFFGGGAYVVAFLMQAGIVSGWLAWPLAALAAAVAGTAIGALSLRTHGVYFIMITLAFAQMVYYSIVSLQVAGGDDGLSLAQRSALAPFDLADDATLYWVTLAVLAACLGLLRRLERAPFGRVLAGLRDNELRMAALGYPVERIKLVCFVAGAAVAGLAGALLVNQNGMASPAQLYWTQSGMLLVMAILGGVGQRYGAIVGASVLLGLEEMLGQWSEYPHLLIGLILLGVALWVPHGLAGLGQRRS